GPGASSFVGWCRARGCAVARLRARAWRAVARVGRGGGGGGGEGGGWGGGGGGKGGGGGGGGGTDGGGERDGGHVGRVHVTGSFSGRSAGTSAVTVTADGSRSPGDGITLPGVWTAAAPWATAEARASGPRPPAMRNPASEESPAPTLLRTVSTRAVPNQVPSASTSSCPSAPRLARTARAPISRSSPAALAASPTVASGRPTASASSSALGFTTSGCPRRAASRAGPEVSR